MRVKFVEQNFNVDELTLILYRDVQATTVILTVFYYVVQLLLL